MVSSSPHGAAALVAIMTTLMPLEHAGGQAIVTHSTGAESDPHGDASRRSIVQDGQGYVIRDGTFAQPMVEPAPATMIAIGDRLRIDAKILTRRASAGGEAVHAHRD